MANCSDNRYLIKNTDANLTSTVVQKAALITDEVDIALVGKRRLEYGEIFDENVLHLLENFACPSDAGDDDAPDTAVAFGLLLENPSIGQVWFNSTNDRAYVYDGTVWVPLGKHDDVNGNYGTINDGQTIPLPVSPNGTIFTYDECSWIVTPRS